MKNLILISALALLYGCNDTSKEKHYNGRIKIVEERVYDGVGYTIIEVDGDEYLSQDGAGICPLTKKTKPIT